MKAISACKDVTTFKENSVVTENNALHKKETSKLI